MLSWASQVFEGDTCGTTGVASFSLYHLNDNIQIQYIQKYNKVFCDSLEGEKNGKTETWKHLDWTIHQFISRPVDTKCSTLNTKNL